MFVKILCENRTNRSECLAEHGLSVYIETAGRRILFDLGASDICIQNAKKMKVGLEKVDTVVISHGHYDHTGGVPAFCEINQTAEIYVHEKAFAEMYGMENGKLDKEPCGIQWTEAQHRQVAGRLVPTGGTVWLTEDIVVSGTIPRTEEFVPTEVFYIKNRDGSLSPDPMDHEQFLAIREYDQSGRSKGVFVFSGCSHTGVLSCLRYAKSLFPQERLWGCLAGMHLYHASAKTRKTILDQIASEELDYVLPVHCTGIHAICELRQLLGERCILAGTGDELVF